MVIAAAALSIGGRPVASAAHAISAADLLKGDLLGGEGGPSEPIESHEMLVLSDDMRTFIRDHVNPGATDVFRMQQLISAIMGKRSLGLEYDENTRTAAETFRLHQGNCLSFAAMFVALARGAGLKAVFQEVDIPPDWSMRKDVFVLNRHVNVSVDLGASGVNVVDFNIGDFKTTYDVRTIPDRLAIAHFYNNIGVERMQANDVPDAVAFYRLAIIQGDGKFSPAWTNLGSLYQREGFLDHAEAAFLEALKTDKHNAVAMSNLVSLYAKLGDEEKMSVYRKKVQEHRLRNPYFRFELAREAFFERDYDTAIEHLKVATRKERNEDEFYFLLGLSYLMKGQERDARKWMTKAEELAALGPDKQRYSTKIETLLSTSQKLD